MKVAVVNSMAPFVWGGAEELASHLVRNLEDRGIEAESFRLPWTWEPYTGLPREIARSKLLRFDGFDKVISLKFPVYLLDAPNHSTWLIHQYRQAYDLWDSPYCNIPHDENGRRIRDLIELEDRKALGQRDALFTISQEISNRLERSTGLVAEPLRAPLNDPELFIGGDDEGYLLAAGRINGVKRQLMIVEAMQHLGTGTRLIVAGPPESDRDEQELRTLVEKHDLADRVKLDLRFLSREELADYVNKCRAVVYIPFKEDSYGYVTMEAFEACKPVITASDAGELLEIVKDGRTGLVTEPTSQGLAEAMKRYAENPELARGHGREAQALWRSCNITWPDTIDRLIGVSQC